MKDFAVFLLVLSLLFLSLGALCGFCLPTGRTAHTVMLGGTSFYLDETVAGAAGALWSTVSGALTCELPALFTGLFDWAMAGFCEAGGLLLGFLDPG